MNLGRAIRICRAQRGYHQQDLAKKAQISPSYLSLIESNARDPSFSTIEKLATALSVPANIIVFLASEPSDLAELDPELRERLSEAALSLIVNDRA